MSNRSKMSSLPQGLGFMPLVGNATPNQELLWLASVFSGIIMCKIVYKLTGIVSHMCFKGYENLSGAVKVEWDNRGFSTFHAVFIAFASVYLLQFSDLFKEGYSDVSLVHRTSALSESVLGISIGYFLSDLAMILWHYPALGGVEYIVHHGLSMYSIIFSLLSGQAQIYIFMVLFSESTTPFVNLRWYLDHAGQKNSKFYIYNGVALFLGWLVARIFLFIYFFAHIFIHRDQVKQMTPAAFYSLFFAPPLLAMMNIFWFWKITKGMMKTLTKARHGQ